MRLFFIIVLFLKTSFTFSQITEVEPKNFDFVYPSNEINCFNHFDRFASGFNPINAFFLAKMSEMMYPERLDYQLRYLINDSKPLTDLESTANLKISPLINNANFKSAFEARFAHYFEHDTLDPNSSPPSFYFIAKSKIDTVSYFGIKSLTGVDPELIIIDYQNIILILYRGTDDIDNIRFAEWKGTDFNVLRTRSDATLNYAMVHKGFWNSFKYIKDDLLDLLSSLDAKNKSIWLSGHSLGGAMAILSGTYLKNLGYHVTNIYTFASPRTIGDQSFAALSNSILPDRIHRFEYYLDPFCIMTMPGYENVGKRHWFDNATLTNYKLHQNCGERYLFKKPFEFMKKPFADKEKTESIRIKRASMYSLITKIPYKLYYHNTQWSVKATYNLIPIDLRNELPKVDDSYPYIYYGWDKGK